MTLLDKISPALSLIQVALRGLLFGKARLVGNLTRAILSLGEIARPQAGALSPSLRASVRLLDRACHELLGIDVLWCNAHFDQSQACRLDHRWWSA